MSDQKSHTIHLGHITESGRDIDEVLVSIFIYLLIVIQHWYLNF